MKQGKILIVLLIAITLIASANAELIVNKYSNDFMLGSPIVNRLKACSCETLVDPVYIENTGNFAADYKISILSDNADWFKLSEQDFPLQPGERKTIVVYTQIPCGYNGENTFEVKAESSFGREKKLIQTIDITKCQNSLMKVFAQKQVANLGESVDYLIRVKNIGEFVEEYKLDFGSFNEFMLLKGKDISKNASFFLYPGQTKDIQATLKLPFSFYGDYEIPFKVYSEKNKAHDTKIIKLTIENQYDHSIILDKEANVCSKIQEKINFEVKNNINFENNYEVKVKGASFLNFEPKTFHLDGNESKNITLFTNPNNKELGNHKVIVSVKSVYGDIEKSKLLNLNVRDCFNYEAGFQAMVKGEPKLVNTYQETTCCGPKNYQLTVHNLGETKEAYEILYNAPSWFSSSTKVVNLKPDEMVNIDFTADLPCSDEVYEIPVEVVLKKHPEIKNTALFKINSLSQESCHKVSVDEQKIVLDKDTKIIPVIVENTGVEGGSYELLVKGQLYKGTLEPSVEVAPGKKKIIHLLTQDNLTEYFKGKYKGELNLTLNITTNNRSIIYSKQFVSKLKNKGFFQKVWEKMTGFNYNDISPCMYSLIVLAIITLLMIVFTTMVVTGKAQWFSKGLFTDTALLIAKIVISLLLVLAIISLILAPSPSKASFYEAPIQGEQALTYQWYQNENHAIDLSQYFIDPDNDNLSFSANSPNNIDVEIIDSIAILKPKRNFAGSEQVVFSATDSEGAVTDSPIFTLIVLQKKDLSAFDWVKKFCTQINYSLLILIFILALLALVFVKTKKNKNNIKKLKAPIPPKMTSRKKTTKKTVKRNNKKTTKRSAHSLAVDRALVSVEEHEVKNILKTKGKRATKSNIVIVQKAIREFKASKIKPKNRNKFYQYMKDKRINQRLRNKK